MTGEARHDNALMIVLVWSFSCSIFVIQDSDPELRNISWNTTFKNVLFGPLIQRDIPISTVQNVNVLSNQMKIEPLACEFIQKGH